MDNSIYTLLVLTIITIIIIIFIYYKNNNIRNDFTKKVVYNNNNEIQFILPKKRKYAAAFDKDNNVISMFEFTNVKNNDMYSDDAFVIESLLACEDIVMEKYKEEQSKLKKITKDCKHIVNNLNTMKFMYNDIVSIRKNFKNGKLISNNVELIDKTYPIYMDVNTKVNSYLTALDKSLDYYIYAYSNEYNTEHFNLSGKEIQQRYDDIKNKFKKQYNKIFQKEMKEQFDLGFSIWDIAKQVKRVVGDVMKPIDTNLSELPGKIETTINNAASPIVTQLSSMDQTYNNIKQTVDSISYDINNVSEKIKSITSNVNTLPNIGTDVSKFIDLMKTSVDSVKEDINKLPNNMAIEIGKNINNLESIISRIQTGMDDLPSLMEVSVTKATDEIKKIPNSIDNGFNLGFEVVNSLSNEVKKIPDLITKEASNINSSLIKTSDIFQSVSNEVNKMPSLIINNIDSSADKVLTEFNNMGNRVDNLAENIINIPQQAMDIVENNMNTRGTALNRVVNGIENIPNEISKFKEQTFNNLNNVTNTLEYIPTQINQSVDTVRNMVEQRFDIIQNQLTSLPTQIDGTVNDVQKSIVQNLNMVAGTLQSLPQQTIGELNSFVNSNPVINQLVSNLENIPSMVNDLTNLPDTMIKEISKSIIMQIDDPSSDLNKVKSRIKASIWESIPAPIKLIITTSAAINNFFISLNNVVNNTMEGINTGVNKSFDYMLNLGKPNTERYTKCVVSKKYNSNILEKYAIDKHIYHNSKKSVNKEIMNLLNSYDISQKNIYSESVNDINFGIQRYLSKIQSILQFIMQDMLTCSESEIKSKLNIYNEVIRQTSYNIELMYMYQIYYIKFATYKLNGKQLYKILNMLVNHGNYTATVPNVSNNDFNLWKKQNCNYKIKTF